MEPDELTLSDVHVGQNKQDTNKCKNDYPVFVSRFEFVTPIDGTNEMESNDCTELTTDEDGDTVVARRPRRDVERDVIYIEHAMATRLVDVGLQRPTFSGTTALELGAGVGLVSITMATVANQVYCTDVGLDVLSTCAHNVQLNNSLFTRRCLSSLMCPPKPRSPLGTEMSCDDEEELPDVICVRQLDWSLPDPYHDDSGEFSWSEADRQMLDGATVLLAADVIYDNKITDAFFKTVLHLLCQPRHRTLYLALEKRLNFTLDDMDVSCPAYSHFLSWVEMCTPDGSTGITATPLPTSFPQSFNYKRTEYLELWKFEGP